MVERYIYLYRITLTIYQKDYFYFGIRTCKDLPENDINYYGSPKTNKHLWDIATYKKKDTLRFLPFSEENYKILSHKESIIIMAAKKKYGIYDEDDDGDPMGGRCLNVNGGSSYFMTEMVKRKIGAAMASKIGSKNHMYGTCWINHPLVEGRKKIKKELLPEYLDQGWLLGSKGYRILPMTNPRLFPKNIEKMKKWSKLSHKLFNDFVDGDYKSIADFIHKTGYKHSFQNMRLIWKTWIPHFNEMYHDCKGKATKPFTSKDAKEWISNR